MNAIIEEDIQQILSRYSGWLRLKNKAILITGASGFLPAYMADVIMTLNRNTEQNSLVIALVRNRERAVERFKDYLNHPLFKLVVQDVAEELVYNEKIDFIIHAASQASPKYYGSDPVGTLSSNVLGTHYLLKLAKIKAVSSFLFFSSSEVYGASETAAIDEKSYGYLDPLNIRSCYAESKRMGETMCVSWFHQHGVEAKIVRPFHTYGPGMQLNDGRVFADFVSNVIEKKNIELNSDGSARRAFCYLADAALAYFMILLEGKSGEAYNVANPAANCSVLELANLIVSIKPELNLKVVFNVQKNDAYLKSSVVTSLPNIDKIKQLGWLPETDLFNGFDRTIKSFLQ